MGNSGLLLVLCFMAACQSAPLAQVCSSDVPELLRDIQVARRQMNRQVDSNERRPSSVDNSLKRLENHREFWSEWAVRNLRFTQTMTDSVLVSLDPMNTHWRSHKSRMNQLADRWLVLQGMAQNASEGRFLEQLGKIEKEWLEVASELCQAKGNSY